MTHDIHVESGETAILFNENTLRITIISGGKVWSVSQQFEPFLTAGGAVLKFAEAGRIAHHAWETGVGRGVRSTFEGFRVGGVSTNLSFETIVWVEDATGGVFFEFVPLCDDGVDIEAVHWPGPFEFLGMEKGWYTALNILQGLIIPNGWPVETGPLNFNGQFCSTAAYMPWWGQVRPDGGYIAICREPWDAAYDVRHPAGGPCEVSVRWLPSLGRMAYRRTLRYTFLGPCDYNDLCKVYRKYARETGLLVTLAEKAARNPLVDKLIGSAIVHTGIKSHVTPGSAYYNRERPEANDSLTPFSVRTAQMRKLRAAGLEKVYLHLDGWGQPGYDNQHPDYLPPCAEAGGWQGMRELSDTMKELNYMFGIHDQYRDYYFDARTFDADFALRKPDGTIFDYGRWAGGRQSYLCTTQAPFYVKRNFEELFRNGIQLEGTYLDVFTCNEPDECDHPWHRMTRRECLELRGACFDYLTSRGILPSSEEVVDWSMRSLVYAHYGPYEFMLRKPDAPRTGIPVPLFNLVYHDCVILPWTMESAMPDGDRMLYALLNGGAAYLDCEADGAELDRQIQRYRTVAALQERVAKCEMVRHEFLNEENTVERTVFSDGTAVTVDHAAGTYRL